jgi:hypothetical protein
VEQIVTEPSRVGSFLSSTLLGITGVAALPSRPSIFSLPSAPGVKAPCAFGALEQAVAKIGGKVGDVYKHSLEIVRDANALQLSEDVRALSSVATDPLMWREFDDGRAWHLIRHDTAVFGRDFDAKYKSLAKQIEEIDPLLTAANTAVLEFDMKAGETPVEQECVAAAKAIGERRNSWVAVLQETAGDDSPFRETIARYGTASKLWADYKAKLADSTWRDHAVEIVVEGTIATDAVLRADAVFASPDASVSQRVQRSLVLGVQTYFPILAISAGVGVNTFDFRQLQLVSATSTAVDGTTSVRSRLELADDTTWEPIVPVWLQSVRIWNWSAAGVYGTFGTTPDRNIFRNAIWGGSIVVPRWRTTFTIGMLSARGHREKDLQPLIRQFSGPDGFALADVAAASIPLPTERWHHSPYVSVTFALASF